MKKLLLIPQGLVVCAVMFVALVPLASLGQIAISSLTGNVYSQNFDSLSNSPAGATPVWSNNTTLPGWYASRQIGGTFTNYQVDVGAAVTGRLYSYGSTNGINPATDRALGFLSSGTPKTLAFGLRFTNDTTNALNVTVSFTGEQWRAANGASAVTNMLTFWHRLASSAITDPDPTTNATWTSVSDLNFKSPYVTTNAGIALDGNASTNRQIVSGIVLANTTFAPGQELFLRWVKTDDTGSDAGLAVDELTVSFSTPFRFTDSSLTEDGVFQARLIGPTNAAKNYVVAVSASVNGPYTPLLAVSAASGSNDFSDFTAPDFSRLYYRAYIGSTDAGPPAIVLNPASRTNDPGTVATFTALGNGATPLTYQWYRNGAPLSDGGNISGVNTTILTISSLSQSNADFYGVRVTNAFGSAFSDLARLTVVAPPIILTHPQSRTNSAGIGIQFTVTAVGAEPLAYQWKKDGTNIAGGTQFYLTLTNLSQSDEGSYSVVITNSAGSATSSNAVLKVNPPFVTSQPTSLTVTSSSTVSFFVTATGAPPVFYQWRLNGIAVDNATNSTFTITDAQPTNCGAYYCTIYNSQGAVNSDVATLIMTNLTEFSASDSFAARGSLGSATNGGGRGKNFSATKEAGEPKHANNRGGASLWLKWSPTNTGIATFSTRGSGFDTLLAIYTGSAFSNLVAKASDDDSAGVYNSAVTFNAAAGTEYQIAIDGFYGAKGDYILSWNLETTSLKVPEIVGHPASQTVGLGTNVTLSVLVTNLPVTYQWRFNGTNILSETNSSLSILNVDSNNIGAYRVEVSTTNVPPRSVISRLADIQANTQDEDGGVDSTVRALDKFQDASAASVSNALAATGLSSSFTGTQLFGEDETFIEKGEGPHGGKSCASSRWFYLPINCSATWTLDTIGSKYDTILALYTCTGTGGCTGDDSDFSNLVEVKSADANVGNNTGESFSFDARPGLYYIVIASVNATKKTAKGHVVPNPPTITANPVSTTVTAGNTATFSVAATPFATGSTTVPTDNALIYKWFKGSSKVKESTENFLDIPNATTTLSGKQYKVEVSNCNNKKATSTNATLTVQP